jgi:glucose-1-phosphate adenylyltransferase
VLFPGVIVEEGSVIEGSIIMSNCRIEKNSFINSSILGERVIVGNNTKIGVGELVANEFKPGVYNSGITVIGEGAIVPDNVEIGRNVMIDINSTVEDYCSLKVASGKNVFKGGVCE